MIFVSRLNWNFVGITLYLSKCWNVFVLPWNVFESVGWGCKRRTIAALGLIPTLSHELEFLTWISHGISDQHQSYSFPFNQIHFKIDTNSFQYLEKYLSNFNLTASNTFKNGFKNHYLVKKKDVSQGTILNQIQTFCTFRSVWDITDKLLLCWALYPGSRL